MNLRRERKIKYWIGLILKILLIMVALVKLFDWKPWSKNDSEGNVENQVFSEDSLVNSRDKMAKDSENQRIAVKVKPIANTASIYIFTDNGLDSQIINQLSKTYFGKYSIQMASRYDMEQLLSGDLTSAKPTELVCVGRVNYSYTEDEEQMDSCELSLQFDTYNQISGEIVSNLSTSITQYGIGFSKNQAKSVAIGKVHP